MDDSSDTDNSNMFKVDHSQVYDQQNMEKRLDTLFNKDKVILEEGQKRMVVYGTMQEQQKTIYEIVQPYFWKAAEVTGLAGKQIYKAFTNGAAWLYDKLIYTVIPYTKQEVPKWFFIIKDNKSKSKKIENSQSFEVLQIDENDYNIIKSMKKNETKKRVIVPLDSKEDPQFIEFLKQENYKIEYSFPIDMDSDQEQSIRIPSMSFKVVYNETVNKNPGLQQYETGEFKVSPAKQSPKKEQANQEKREDTINQNPTQVDQTPKQSGIRSIIGNTGIQYVEDYKKIEKNVWKIKDCFIFQFEGKNSIEYDLLDGIERDESAQCGYLIKSNKFNIHRLSNDSSDSHSGEVPLLTQKQVDNKMKVRVEIPEEKMNIKVPEKQLELA